MCSSVVLLCVCVVHIPDNTLASVVLLQLLY